MSKEKRDPDAFGREVKRLRKLVKADDGKSLTQQQLAERMGTNQTTIAFYETGRIQSVDALTLFRLSDALNVPLEHWRPLLGPDALPAAPASPAGEPADPPDDTPAAPPPVPRGKLK